MKILKVKLLICAVFVTFFWSCQKDTEDFNEAEEAVIEIQNEGGMVTTKADPSMNYFLHGKQLRDTKEIENLLKTAMHMEVEDDNWIFYPTEEEQKNQMQKRATAKTSAQARRNTYLFLYGYHEHLPFHHMTNQPNHHYNYVNSRVHHRLDSRARIKLWQKITRGATIMNFNDGNRYNPYHDRVYFAFYSHNNYRGRSIVYEVRAATRRRNINLPYHIGSHKSF